MPRCVIKTPVGEAAFDLDEPQDIQSFYLFAMHKSGSVLINRMISQSLSIARIPQIPLSELAFQAGLPENEILNPEELIFERGYCYRGFRGFPPYLKRFEIAQNKKILLVRDPRDMVVSFYFSAARSHALPSCGIVREQLLHRRTEARTTDIDEYCQSIASAFISKFQSYESILSTELRLYRYEDVIFDKKSWLTDMLNYLEVVLDRSSIERIATQNDVWPEVENPSLHIRQVKPGNFRRHLSRESIDFLNEKFRDVLIEHNYSI
jgi:hypothetical protein